MKNNLLIKIFLLALVSALSLFAFARQEKVIKIISGGQVVNEYNASAIDYIQIDDLIGAPADQPVFGNQTFTANGVSFNMVRVEGGTYQMGSNDGPSDEKPIHSETVATFSIGETEVTQELWEAVMGSDPSKFSGTNLPVECVSWDDCQTFISKLNELTGQTFRLPTEAEWEYAARGGNQSKGYKYSGSDNIWDVAWYTYNINFKTHAVGHKQANELGIYDMSGNVWELCSDRYSSDYNSSRDSSDHVIRGGSWRYGATDCRVANRSCSSLDVGVFNTGLRLAL